MNCFEFDIKPCAVCIAPPFSMGEHKCFIETFIKSIDEHKKEDGVLIYIRELLREISKRPQCAGYELYLKAAIKCAAPEYLEVFEKLSLLL